MTVLSRTLSACRPERGPHRPPTARRLSPRRCGRASTGEQAASCSTLEPRQEFPRPSPGRRSSQRASYLFRIRAGRLENLYFPAGRRYVRTQRRHPRQGTGACCRSEISERFCLDDFFGNRSFGPTVPEDNYLVICRIVFPSEPVYLNIFKATPRRSAVSLNTCSGMQEPKRPPAWSLPDPPVRFREKPLRLFLTRSPCRGIQPDITEGERSDYGVFIR